MCGGEWLLATSATRQAPGSRRPGPGRPVVPGHVADLRSFLRSLSEAFLSLYCPRCREQRGVRETGTRPGGGRVWTAGPPGTCHAARLGLSGDSPCGAAPFSGADRRETPFRAWPAMLRFPGCPCCFPAGAPRRSAAGASGLQPEPRMGRERDVPAAPVLPFAGARECALRPRDRRTLLTPRGAPGPPGRGSDTSGWTKRGTEPGPGRGR